MTQKNIQLEMTFEKVPNVFRSNMEGGNFTVLFEIPSPSKNDDFSASASFLSAMEGAIMGVDKTLTGLAITDRTKSADSCEPADFANSLLPESKGRTLVFLSGKDLTIKDMNDKIEKCRSSNLFNIAAVSGDYLMPDGSVPKRSRRSYVESVHTLAALAERKDPDIYAGSAVNPYIYTAPGIYSQYYSLVKKIKRGASFVVSQAGWDMVKLQELKWFLESRELHAPVISRLFLLTPEIVHDIVSGRRPGIYMSRDMGKIIERESKYGSAQFLSAQWRRLQLKAAGAKLIGCSGIMISGLERPEHVPTICQKISEALKEFSSFEDWRQAYVNYLSKADMAPYPKRFYMFENLFTRQHPEVKIASKVKDCSLSGREKLSYRVCKFLFKKSNVKFSGEQFMAKKLFASCKSCSYCRLPLTQFVCPEICPKGMANGPCGGIKIDATCEISDSECVHSKRFRLALWKNELDTLEDRFIRAPG